jgi:hypothetical protein
VILHEIGHVVSFEERRRTSLRREALRARRAVRAARYEAQRDEYTRDRARVIAGDTSAELAEGLQRSLAELEREHAELRAEAEVIGAMRAEVDRLRDGLTSVESAYSSLPGALAGPTSYGRSNAQESFAEAFALYHLDPDALRWLTPAVHDWFAASSHLQIPEPALPDVASPPSSTDASTSDEPALEP